MVSRSALFVLVLLLGATQAFSQTIDPYRRLTDPRAITYLDGPDAEPLQYRCAVGWAQERDPGDFYFVLAKGEGAGILTHLWMQLQNQPDSATNLKIYIDDSLIVHDRLYSFFKRPSGAFRPPFDSLQSGGLVCDVQIPFKKNFKVTYYSEYKHCCLFWAVGWRPVLDPVHVEVFSVNPTPQADAQQKAAEKVYWSGESPWKGTPVETFSQDKTITLNDPIEQELVGPGLLTELHIKPSNYETETLRNIWLEMYWDGSPHASVNVPLADFFGAGAGMRNMRSHPIRTQMEGMLTSYFPMPFAVKGKFRIVNRSEKPVGLAVTWKVSREAIDRDRMGYFEAQFNKRNSLRYHVSHPVGYHQGRGRFVGMQLYLPVWEPGYFLEGDPLFHVDSNDENFIRYTGTEDYFNGGWFFSDGPFSLPFAGCTELHTSLYRFHYMDAIDFKSSFELLLHHGQRNDFKVSFRTIGYFYNLWTPFWTSRDTLRRGERLDISGTGYAPGEELNIKLNAKGIATINADASGAFSYGLTIDAGISLGGNILSVNGHARPKPLWITEGPDIYFVRDTFPAYVNWKDTFIVHGTGFAPNKTVSIYLDTTEVLYSSKVEADATGRFVAMVMVPYVDDGEYQVVAASDNGERAMTKQKLLATRTYDLEIENMWPPVIDEGLARPDYMGYYLNFFSEQYYLLFMAEPQKRLVVQFWAPIADTFDVSIYATRGARFGNYNISLDDSEPVLFLGYEDRGFSDPIRSEAISLGRNYLTEGYHYLTFTCISKDERSTEYLLGADNLVLDPVTAYKPLLSSIEIPITVAADKLVLYPNPVQNVLRIAIGHDSADQLVDAEITDALGRVQMHLASVQVLSDGVLSLHLGEFLPGHYRIRLSSNGKSLGSTGFSKY